MLIHESSHSRSTISVRIIIKQEILLWNVNQFMFHRLRSFIGTRQMSGKAGCSLSSWSTIWQGLARSVRDVCLSTKYSILNTVLSIQFSCEKWYEIWNKNMDIYSLNKPDGNLNLAHLCYLQVLPIYMHIRVLVSAYLFLTGYGHFSYFWNKTDYSVQRYCQVSG